MIKKAFILIFLFLIAIPLVNGQTVKFKHCPDVKKIKIVKLQKAYAYMYLAYNDNNHYFVSKEYIGDENNGPAPAVHLNKDLTSYDATNKKLSCVYYAYAQAENSKPTLINVGDY